MSLSQAFGLLLAAAAARRVGTTHKYESKYISKCMFHLSAWHASFTGTKCP